MRHSLQFRERWFKRRRAPATVVALLGLACTTPQVESYGQSTGETGTDSRIVVIPASTTLEIGDSAALRAVEVIGRADTVPIAAVTWETSNTSIATVSRDGIVRAVGAGLAGISAHADDQVSTARVIVTSGPSIARQSEPSNVALKESAAPPLSNSSRVSSAAAAAPPPRTFEPGEASGRRPDLPNEPAGYRTITDRHFTHKASSREDTGPEGSDGWNGGEFHYRNFSIVEDPTAPTGDGKVGQMLYRANHRAGTGPASVRLQMPPGLKEVYISVWAKLSPNWVGNQASINKIFFFGVAGGNNQFIFTAYGSGRNRLQARMSLQGVLDERSFLLPNLGRNAFVERGTWQQWEFVLRCNSGLNRSDGSADLWLNGEHITSVNDINWTQTKHPTRPCNMNMMNWNPTYGGGGASPGVEQWLRFDRVYISGR